jgi:hypothetical protein
VAIKTQSVADMTQVVGPVLVLYSHDDPMIIIMHDDDHAVIQLEVEGVICLPEQHVLLLDAGQTRAVGFGLCQDHVHDLDDS